MIFFVSDTRFTLIGVGLIFAGFMILGIFGSQFIDASVEAEEFGNCFEYFEDRPPVPVDCDLKYQNKSLFFVLVIVLIGAGIISLIKGVKGKWDQDVKPEDMVGPGGKNTSNSDKPDSDKNDSK
jgi:hypothetical protein